MKKDWRKSDSKTWYNINKKCSRVEISPFNKSYIVQTEKGCCAEGLIAIEKSKVKAMKRAQQYMKTH